MRLNQMWTSAPGLVWTGWRRRSMIGPQNSTSSRFNANVLKKEYFQSHTKLFCSLWKNLTADNTRRWGWGRPQPTCRCSTGPTSKFCSRPQFLHQLNSTLFERSGWTLPLDIIAVMITYGGSNAMICHGAGVKNKTLSDLVLKWEYTSKRNKAKNTFGNIIISWEIRTKSHSYYHLGWNLSMPKENYRSTIIYTTNPGRLFSIRVTFLQIVDSPETLKAIGGCFGLAGIVTAITLK